MLSPVAGNWAEGSPEGVEGSGDNRRIGVITIRVQRKENTMKNANRKFLPLYFLIFFCTLCADQKGPDFQIIGF